ncbi:hypothetical protein CPAST_c12070 [Clostridium pasteurianum DSM 525 = ATCC 6013]|uniref:YetF C-terminal domain-containing protein n=1 Tax=Clostridium pasteurianum DSM 525 = ATCC 6013 TaxID=1262449 RepID=A0A0H3J3B9_CLOPA|nr:DUF421 domain-containing protein [Clostridium pasteurianum]AJA47307.1 hypothetical protein CPAST_c12070 [Clostridium pasteurianum DSM 525 = ATCC 6013]AJA51295.1 hypothetical protein CLPA_c12070 [Clostridium pasteurianum DSM 525 = ATCC 6013]AOZ74647.1 hypothetical protein AQ983_05830 [Clostridium pasteurianum DSM 525 = ATCC 6013]AOZ78444.1 hypothetical protein AQ984_05820 [Clostridium pasteurianum]ELP58644.1 hypothetical protein F502_12713 [Clostridium pasteurianum DSM 525 = ATCC 6013]
MQNWIIVVFRTMILFFLNLVIVRIIGKVNLAKMTPFKFVTYMIIAIISAAISLGLIGNIVFGILALAVWFLLSLAIDYLSIKSKFIHDFINGRETILMKDGKVMEDNLMGVRYTGEELLRELRSKNAFNLADVEFAVMESTGEVNVLLKSEKQPITSHDLQRKVAPADEPETVVLDGNILDESLKNRGLTREWLKAQLSNFGVSLDNVFIAQVDSSGDIFIDTFDDSIQIQQSQVKELLYASISKVQADLFTFSLETNNPQIKKMYSHNADKIKKMMDELEPYLLR